MSRWYRPGDTYRKSFSVGAADADALPAASLLRNCVVDGTVAVTVTKVDDGLYRATCTIPVGYAAGDVVELRVEATLDGAADQGVVDAIRLVGFDPAAAILPASVAAYGAGQDPATLLGARLDGIDSSIEMLTAAEAGFAGLGLEGEVDGSTAPTATSFKVTLAAGSEFAGGQAELAGLTLRFRGGARRPQAGTITSGAIRHSSTSLTLTFASGTFAGAPADGDPVTIAR